MRKTGLGFLLLAAVLFPTASVAGERSFTVANVEYEGTRAFLPSVLIVQKGDKVKVRVLNNIPSDPNQHGFAIHEFGVEKVVTRGEPEEIEFVAEREGLFPITCHLHPAHLGGQILVLPAAAAE
jgi:nitrosocyanin